MLHVVNSVFLDVKSFKTPNVLSVTLILNYRLKQLKMQNPPEELQKMDETTTLFSPLLSGQKGHLGSRF